LQPICRSLNLFAFSSALLALLALFACSVYAGIETGITSVARLGKSSNCAPELGGSLVEGSVSYCDQSHTWTTFPPEADGRIIDYLVVSDADSSVADYGLSFTVELPGSVLLFIDPTINVAAEMPWVISDGYQFEPGLNFTLDQGGPMVVFDLWARDIEDPGIPVTTGPQNNAAVSNYGVAYVTDEADLELTIEDDPDPYRLNSGDEWVRIYTVRNLGPDDTDSTVISLSGSGINDSAFVSLETSPNSTFNAMGQFKWRIPVLEVDEAATLTFTRIFGPSQQTGVGVVTSNAIIESTEIFDPDPNNNSAAESTTVLEFSGGIADVTRLGGSGNCAPMVGGALAEDVPSYCDETYAWTTLPPEAEGELIDYIIVSNADGAEPDYGLSFNVHHPGTVALMLETSIDVMNDMPWVISDGYQFVSGVNLMQDQDGPMVLVDLWARDIDNPADPVVTGPQNNGSVFNYGVVYTTDAADLVVTVESEPEPYLLNSGVNWVRSYTIENLGYADVENVVVGLSATGITDTSFVSLVTSPNSTFNAMGQFKWRMETLVAGGTASMEVTRIFGPAQQTGPDVINSSVEIESLDGFDPNSTNNADSVTTSVLGEDLFQDGFEE
jgi:hypothetical protein